MITSKTKIDKPMTLNITLSLSLLISLAAFFAIQSNPSSGALGRLVSYVVTTEPMPCICSTAVTVRGYKCQEFVVKTDDGYLLSVQRIGGGGGPKSKPPVLLQHGVLVDGMIWLLNPPDESLPFVLADNGFDVWVSNTRGTRFSNRHTTLNTSNPAYWNWTWDDLAEHDLTAVINFVFKQTGQKIYYVGHSMGTLVALASFSERRGIDKVKAAALLSPVAYMSHITSPLVLLLARTFVAEVGKLFGIAEFDPTSEPVKNLVKTLCAEPGIDCYDLLTAFTGKNCCLNDSSVEQFLKNEPQPTSTKNMIHLAQIVRDGRLARYDYKSIKYNMEHYGEPRPPVYNLSNIPYDLPLFLSYGGGDALADVRDVEILLENLKSHDPNKLSIHYIKDFAHADFILGVTAKELVYNQIIAFFRENK